MKAAFSHFPTLACHCSVHKYCLIMIIMTFFSRYAEKFRANYQNDRWNGSMLRRNERLPWWYSQRIRLYVCGHVTNICYAQALYTKGHLTSIAGSNRRPIQLNLFAISVCRSDWLCVCCCSNRQTQNILNFNLPNDSLWELSAKEGHSGIFTKKVKITTSAF